MVHDTDGHRSKEVVEPLEDLGREDRLIALAKITREVCEVDICQLLNPSLPNPKDLFKNDTDILFTLVSETILVWFQLTINLEARH